jgi:hypothetical protein
MPRSSSTWLSSALCALLAGCLGEPGEGEGRLCLPPAFDGGQRLHRLRSVDVFWLELLLRQHEVCWRRPEREDEARVFLLGSSSVFGFPLPSDQTFAAAINRDSDPRDGTVHIYNLAMSFPYQLRDAMILDKALAYQPDLILYPMTLADFDHTAPVQWPALVRFFNSNHDAGLELLKLRPPGLLEPIERYRKSFERHEASWGMWSRLREIGGFVRVMAGEHAYRYATFLTGQPPLLPSAAAAAAAPAYDCAEVKLMATRQYWSWKRWNVLAYLEWMRERTGVEVAVVHWPISHDPRDDCYNALFTDRLVSEFESWLHEEAASRDIPLLDLRESLPSRSFFDTIHLNEQGHRQIAPLLHSFVLSVVRDRPREPKRE